MPTVYRVMNKNGEGPYKCGGRYPDLPYRSCGPQPMPERDFEALRFDADPKLDWEAQWEQETAHLKVMRSLLKPYIFGFPNRQAASKWFGEDGLRQLAVQGFPLIAVEADQIVVSDSGAQCLFTTPSWRPITSYADEVEEKYRYARDVYPEAERYRCDRLAYEERARMAAKMGVEMDGAAGAPTYYVPIKFEVTDTSSL